METFDAKEIQADIFKQIINENNKKIKSNPKKIRPYCILSRVY